MKIRASRISASIARAITSSSRSRRSLLGFILAFFRFFSLYLTRFHPADFARLREEAWQLDEDAYHASFAASSQAGKRGRKGKQRVGDGAEGGERGGEEELVPVGDLGYSGSTFFTSADGRFLIKSLPRAFEYEFFARDLFFPYLAHMTRSPQSLLVRITDMVYSPRPSIGGLFGFAPTHHIVMENLLHGKETVQERTGSEESGGSSVRWETYDLKPSDYFFPERDLADGKLAPESVKAKLVDEFPGKIHMTEANKKMLLEQLSADTQLLADHSAVDYSLFLIRYPGPNRRSQQQDAIPRPVGSDRGNLWRTGIDDSEGEWTYRCVVLDFFWAKHKTRAKMMTLLVDLLDLVARKGPMSITADPGEYRQRFLGMVEEMVVSVGE